MSKQLRSVLAIAAVCLVVFFGLSVFLGYRQARTPAHLRQTMGDSAAKACRSNPEVTANATPGQVVSFCNCVVDTTLSSMSDAEITAAADRGAPDASDRAKLAGAQQQCRARLHPGM